MLVWGAASRSLRMAGSVEPPGMLTSSTSTRGVVSGDPPFGQLHVTGLGDHLEVLFGVEQETQAGPHDLVIIGDHDRDLPRRPLAAGRCALVAHAVDSSTVPGSILIAAGSRSVTAPRIVTPPPKVTSPSITRRSASRREGGPSGKRRSNSSMSL